MKNRITIYSIEDFIHILNCSYNIILNMIFIIKFKNLFNTFSLRYVLG